jgi:hypothetical protein
VRVARAASSFLKHKGHEEKQDHEEEENAMGLFCADQDLLGWESGIFGDAGVAHLALVKDADATLSGGTLLTAAAVLGGAEPGMVAVLRQGSGETLVTTYAVITTNLAANQASVSVLRSAGEDPAVPAMSGAVKVTIVSFHPVIAAVGDELLALLGIEPRMLTEASTVMGLKTATIFGTLAALFRAIGPSAAADKKLALYTRMFQLARRAVGGWVDADGDGVAERRVCAGIAVMERE